MRLARRGDMPLLQRALGSCSRPSLRTLCSIPPVVGPPRCIASLKPDESRFLAPLNARKARGVDVLNDPLWNKGTGFTHAERDRLGLKGLLPNVVRTLDEQRANVMAKLREIEDPMEKNLMLRALHDRNETLFHRVLVDHVEEVAPIVYTPTVGLVCQRYSSNFQRARGLLFTPEDKGSMGINMENWPQSSCQVVVVTDGSRILGLGDLGANGMGIPVGKLALYCAYGGIAPHRVLPVQLDFGTDNEALLNDPLYTGVRAPRLKGDEYFALVDEFVQAVFRRYPRALLQFEDFSSDKASILLDKYRDRYLCFNDDIQGTGATVLAGVLGALRMTGKPPEALANLKVAVVGAGSAGIGVAQALQNAMVEAGAAAKAAAAANFMIFDKDGLVGSSRKVGGPITEEVMSFARADLADGMSLDDAVSAEKPELILGLSGRKGTITYSAIEAMAEAHERPMVFPLSNPTSACEITPAEVYELTRGRAIVATGSPFAPVTLPDGSIRAPSQCNNMYIFPGVGLGASVCGAETVPDSMLYHAAVALSRMTTDEELKGGRVFPSVTAIRNVSREVGIACAEHAYDKGIARTMPARHETAAAFVERKMYYPEYVPIFSKLYD